jgi:hypothetical protein
MEKAFDTISLIPYLKSAAGGFRLEIALAEARHLQEYEFPFQLAQAPRPLSRLVKARIITDQDATIKQFFLLIQNHEAASLGDGLTQMTNTTIDTLWQQTRMAYSHYPERLHGFIPFPDKGDASDKGMRPRETRENGKCPLFKPLFFCKERHLFFHPPCPECGTGLTLCRDDDQLKQAGLAMFSTSMERHLYCPGCIAAKDSPIFYKYSRQPDDAVFVKDRVDLVVDFKQLRTPGEAQCGFPCTTCPNHSECYILDQKAKERIAFFSFYPFYMLMFEAWAMNAVDFLALASGAPEKEVNQALHQGKKGVPHTFPYRFFFEHDERLFLEILFVKLSFLHQVLTILGTRTEQAIFSGTGFTAQSLWIEPMRGTTPLPWLWNFRITLIDLLETAPGHSGSRDFSIHAFFRFFSSLWFYTLAVNKTQTFERVLRKVDAAIISKTAPPFSMDDIFWEPDCLELPQEHQRFWADAIRLGLKIRTIPKNSSLDRETALLASQIKTLEQGVREALFASPQSRPMPPPEKSASPETNKNPALARMLTTILQRWQTETTEPMEEMEEMEEMEDDDILETVVLSSPKEEQGLDKTVVIPPGSRPCQEEELEETMIRPSLHGPGSPRPDEKGFDDMEETMIIPSLHGPGSPCPDEKGFDDMEETMIIPSLHGPGSPCPDEKGFDDMEETVILTPEKEKKEKKEKTP